MKSDPSKMRDTNLSDGRKLDLLASVTTYLSDMIAKKQLNKWIKTNVAKTAARIILDMMGGTCTFKEDITFDELVENILRRSDVEVNEAAKFGNEIHDMVEAYALDRTYVPQNQKLMPWFEQLKVWWEANVHRVYFAETTVVGDCYAGRMDLIAEMKDGRILIIDWKTRKRQKPRTKAEIASGYGKFGTYETDIIQLCAYRKAVMKMDDCPRIDGVANVFIDSENPTPLHQHDWNDDKVEQHTHCWDYLAKAWCWLKNYHPKVEGGIDVNV
jgi:hypothetical protein